MPLPESERDERNKPATFGINKPEFKATADRVFLRTFGRLPLGVQRAREEAARRRSESNQSSRNQSQASTRTSDWTVQKSFDSEPVPRDPRGRVDQAKIRDWNEQVPEPQRLAPINQPQSGYEQLPPLHQHVQAGTLGWTPGGRDDRPFDSRLHLGGDVAEDKANEFIRRSGGTPYHPFDTSKTPERNTGSRPPSPSNPNPSTGQPRRAPGENSNPALVGGRRHRSRTSSVASDAVNRADSQSPVRQHGLSAPGGGPKNGSDRGADPSSMYYSRGGGNAGGSRGGASHYGRGGGTHR